MDYHEQLKFLSPSILDSSNYWDFRLQHFISRGFNWTPSRDGNTFIHKRLAQHCFFMTREQAGLGGAKIYQRRIVKMPKQTRELYEQLENDFYFEDDGLEGRPPSKIIILDSSTLKLLTM